MIAHQIINKLEKHKSKSSWVTKPGLSHSFLSFSGQLMKCHHTHFEEEETEVWRNEGLTQEDTWSEAECGSEPGVPDIGEYMHY